MLFDVKRFGQSIIQPVFIRKGHGIDNAGMKLSWPGYGLGIHRIKHSYTYETDVATSITFIAPKEVFDIVGYYDEKFSPAYMEDVDWSIRSKKMGVRHFVCPSANVMHRHNESFSKEYSKLGISNICRKNRQYLIRKHYRGLDRIIRTAVSSTLDVGKKAIDIITDRWVTPNNRH